MERLPGKQKRPIAARLIALRTAYGHPTQIGFASFLGYSPQRWSVYENGATIPAPAAVLVVQKCPGVTLDWIYFGKAGGLPREVHKTLVETQGNLVGR